MRADTVLEKLEVPYDLITQEKPTVECDEAADQRGIKTSQIVKSLVLSRAGEIFHVCIPGDRKLSERKFGEHRMVSPDKCSELTDQEPGTVHPFASGLKHFIDLRLMEHDILSFTNGEKKKGILITSKDFRAAMENSDFEAVFGDFVVADETDITKLVEREYSREKSKFLSENGYYGKAMQLGEEFLPSRVALLAEELKRNEVEATKQEWSLILEQVESETHLQKKVEEFAQTGKIVESEEFDLDEVVTEVLESNPEAAQELESGRDSAINYLLGQVMQLTDGRCDGRKAKRKINEKMG